MSEHPAKATPPREPSFREALRFWVKLGWISFGGPAGQIAIMHRELVEKKKWVSETHFLHALNFTMLLPGPEAQQLATYLGWRLHGTRGGIAAGTLFVLPSMCVLFALSWFYVAGRDIWWVSAFFHGLMAAVIAILAHALWRISRKALRSPVLWAVAFTAFAAIFFLGTSFVWIVIAAGALGYLGHQWSPGQFPTGGESHALDAGAEAVSLRAAVHASWLRSAKIIAVCMVLWWLPVGLAGVVLGWDSVVAQQGLFFSKAALVTFGGAYAVLPYVAQQAVEHFAWLTHGQMMAGLALAETTPGPLIMVLQFVGFVGAWQNPGAMSPAWAAAWGSLITTWVTFIPCFLFIFLGGPHVERVGRIPRASAALTSITAAVVGVMCNLGVHFTDHALWPGEGEFDWLIAALAIVVFSGIYWWRLGIVPAIGVCGAIGVLAAL